MYTIANEKKITPRQFRDLYCEFGGIRLLFNGEKDTRGKRACSQYVDNFGCSVHLGRPLACRLFPIGRQIQNNEVEYIHQGETFPCLNGCSEVVNLPLLSVGEYLNGQQTGVHEKVQGEYLEIMQNLADVGFELLLDSGLSESGDTKTLPLWREMANEEPENLVKRIGSEWMDTLMIPDINSVDAVLFTQKHNELLQAKIQEHFGALTTLNDCHEASGLIMGIAIHLARAMGTDPKGLIEHWIEIAKSHGAKE